MARIDYLKKFDKRQLFRFFVDGRFHKKYDGWVKYDEREKGSVQAMMNGFSFMMDNLHRQENGLNAMYLLQLHRICMIHVESTNYKSSPGDIRYLRNSMPFFKKTTTLEHIQEVIEMRIDDGTLVFNDKEIRKYANDLDAKEVYKLLLKKEKLSYRPWYPNLDNKTISALDGNETLREFYDAKHYVQKVTVTKMEEIVKRYNDNINIALNDEQKLRAIALIVRELELLHPFSDGNCRTFAGVLLNQLLIYNGFHPSMPYNPNLDGEYSLSQWIDEIKKGIEFTKVLLENPNAKVYDYSINDMSKENQDKFLSISSEFIKKIDEYNEIFLTPEKLQSYTSGIWINYEKNQRFTGVGNSSGNIAFLTSLEDIIKSNGSVKKEINRLIRNKVRAIVIDNQDYIEDIKLPIYLVEDVFKAYEDVSSNIRQDVNPKTILITGTEGKTGTKIQIHHLFKNQVLTHAILNSANAKLPVLRTMANLQKDDKYEIVEFSVDANEDKTIKGAKTVNPDICFFTNIGKEHMHNHKELSGVIKAKSAVVEGIRSNGICIVNSSIDAYDDFVMALKNRRDDINIITYGLDSTDRAYLIKSSFDTKSLMWNIIANIDGEKIEYKIPLVQNHAPLMSVGILLLAKLSALDIQKAAKDYELIKPYESMGLIHKIKKDDKEILFYDQSRRASISGVRSAFKDLENFDIKGKIIILMGSISSVNENEWTKEYHEELAQLINKNKKISKLYTTGSNMKYTHNGLENKELLILHSNNYEKLYEYICSDLEDGDLLFVMGYMRLYLDRFAKMVLENKSLNTFDSKIYSLTKDENLINEYKKMYVSCEVENKNFSYVIRNNSNLDKEEYFEIRNKGFSYRELRANYLYRYFENITNLLKYKYKFESLNDEFKDNGNEKLVYNKEYCNQWFNNFDKNTNETKKQLFGTFFKISKDSDYMLFILVGTVNLHFGIGKYKNNEIIQLNEKEHLKIKEKFASTLDPSIKFTPRTWAKKWVTIDADSFIDLRKANIFLSMNDIENSEIYTNKLVPLIKSIKGD
ncbi:Mur ligase family protein [Poseidonibacter sp.]|uniref:Mur ligase family protein n=1 Tax=Poseidonibacter sp. TaxID=2321188 RepID=UPI003C774546